MTRSTRIHYAVARNSWGSPGELDGELVSQWPTGALLYNAPLEQAAGLGATEIVCVCNVRVLPRVRYSRPRTIPATLRHLDVFFRRSSNVGFADAKISEGLWRDIPFLTIAPPSAPGVCSLLTAMRPTRRQMQRVGLGYNEAIGAFTPWRDVTPSGTHQLDEAHAGA